MTYCLIITTKVSHNYKIILFSYNYEIQDKVFNLLFSSEYASVADCKIGNFKNIVSPYI